MKYLFTILMALVIVTGAFAFGGEYEKSPPVRELVSPSTLSYDVIAIAIDAEYIQAGDNPHRNRLDSFFEAATSMV
jgi:hypothetical protein